MKYFYSLFVFFILFTQGLQAQFKFAEGDDPLGRPYTPTIGVLKSEVAPGIPVKVADQISMAFTNGLKGLGGAPMPYQVVSKEMLSAAVAELKLGKSTDDLRKRGLWNEVVGVQYLLRLEVNSFEMTVDPDSIFDEKNKFVRIDRYSVASANLTARLVDVATSKVLLFNNFDARGTTKGFTEYTNQPDSARALIQLNKQVRSFGGDMVKYVVAGAATITSIYKEGKDRAEEVVVTRTVITAPLTMENLNVYAVNKTYTKNNQIFRDVELVGVINKSKTYDVKIHNFKVLKGEKRIAELFKAGTPLICIQGGFPIGPFMPAEARVGLTFQDFKNTSSASTRTVRILQDCFVELAASRPLLLDAVDRELYDLIKKERELQQKTRSAATQAGISIGSSYLLNAELVTFSEGKTITFRTVTETKPVATAPAVQTQPTAKSKTEKTDGSTNTASKSDKTKPQEPTKATKVAEPAVKPAAPVTTTKKVMDKYEFNTAAKINVSLVSIATGEITYANSYLFTGAASIPYSNDLFEQGLGAEKSFRDLTSKATRTLWNDVQKFVTPAFDLLEVVESNKSGAESILISGGQRSGFFEGMRVEVVELVQETVDGQKLDRDVVLGELKITDLRPETSLCKVKSGSKEIAEKVGTKANLYCRWAN